MAISKEEQDLISAAAEGLIKGVSKDIPVYKDLLQPATQEIGKGLKDAVSLAFTPIRAVVWSFEQISTWIQPIVFEKLKNVSPENIIPPKLSLAGSIFENLRYLEGEEDLRNLFAQLLANSMNKDTAEFVHPGFIETLKNMSSYDAHLFSFLHKFRLIEWAQVYYIKDNVTFQKVYCLSDFEKAREPQFETSLSNLERLGILDPKTTAGSHPKDPSKFPEYERDLNRSISSGRNLTRYYRNFLSNYGKLMGNMTI